jgi:ankyrin repeat protein
MYQLARLIIQDNKESIESLANLKFRTTVAIPIQLDGRRQKMGDLCPLHFSVYVGRPRISEVLIDAGADLNALDKRQRWAPLHFAAWLNDLAHVRLLHQKGADLNVRGGMGATALHISVTNGCIHVTKILLDLGADPSLQNDHRTSALHMALKRECLPSLVLLCKHGARTDVTNSDGKTPIEVAEQMNRLDFLEVLAGRSPLLQQPEDDLVRNADVNRIADIDESTIQIPEPQAMDPYSRYKDPAKVLKKLGRTSFEEIPHDLDYASVFSKLPKPDRPAKAAPPPKPQKKRMTPAQKQQKNWTRTTAGDLQRQASEAKAKEDAAKDYDPAALLDEAEKLLMATEPPKKAAQPRPAPKPAPPPPPPPQKPPASPQKPPPPPRKPSAAPQKPAASPQKPAVPQKPAPPPKAEAPPKSTNTGPKRIEKTLRLVESSESESEAEPESESENEKDDDDLVVPKRKPKSSDSDDLIAMPMFSQPKPKPPEEPPKKEDSTTDLAIQVQKLVEQQQQLLASQQPQRMAPQQPPVVFMWPGYPMNPYQIPQSQPQPQPQPQQPASPDFVNLMHRVGTVEIAMGPAAQVDINISLGMCIGCGILPGHSVCPLCGGQFCMSCREMHCANPNCNPNFRFVM